MVSATGERARRASPSWSWTGAAALAVAMLLVLLVSGSIRPLVQSQGSVTNDYLGLVPTPKRTLAIDPNIKCSDPAARAQTIPQAKEKLLLTYLAQKQHSSYGIDAEGNLRQSLRLLDENVLPWTPADVVVFHEGDFTPEDIANITAGRQHVRFEVFQSRFWCLPDFLDLRNQPSWVGSDRYSLGYRHMIRWYSLHVFQYAHEAGYEWVMRLDDESFVWTPIKYNLPDFMRDNGYVYGHRVSTHEHGSTAQRFAETVREYLVTNKVDPISLYKHCSPQSARGLTTTGWSHFCVFNNFYITKVSFWVTEPVLPLLQFLDGAGGIYTKRWNDNLVQTAAIQTFLPKAQVHKFEDFTYEHTTYKKGRVVWGGLFPGTDDAEAAQRQKDFKAAHGSIMRCCEDDRC